MEGENPSTRQRGFSPSKPPTFPSTAWGCRLKTLRSAVRYAHCLTTEFSCGKLALISAKTFSMSQKSCVRASKVFSLLPRCVFGFRAHSQSLARRVSVLRERSRCFPGVFSAFGSIPKASPAHFRALGAFPLLSRRVFSLWECSQGFPRAVLSFGSVPAENSRAFGSAPAYSHRHCPRVARKSYKIISSGG